MNFADEIKNRVTMPDLMRYYGFALKAGNRLPCPIHGGKNNSMGLKKDFCHCFKCGYKADVIGFVQTYFGLSFQNALVKINADFNLGLPICEKMTARKKMEIAKRSFEARQERKKKELTKKEIEERYWSAFDEWDRIDKQIRENDPRRIGGFNDKYIDAVKKIDGALYQFKLMEAELYEFEAADRNS